MFKIREAKWLAPQVRWFIVEAPRVAARHLPGHFVIVRVREGGERIPLTVADSNAEAGTITLVVQVIGATTERLCALQTGDEILDVVGPLGKPTEIEKFGHVVLVGGGVGTAVIYPQAGALKEVGNKVSAVIGGQLSIPEGLTGSPSTVTESHPLAPALNVMLLTGMPRMAMLPTLRSHSTAPMPFTPRITASRSSSGGYEAVAIMLPQTSGPSPAATDRAPSYRVAEPPTGELQSPHIMAMVAVKMIWPAV